MTQYASSRSDCNQFDSLIVSKKLVVSVACDDGLNA